MRFFASESEHSKRNLILIALAGLALAAAGYLGLVRRGSASGQLNTPESAAFYVCLTDGQTFTLTPAEFEGKIKSHAVISQGPGTFRRGVMKVKCPKCGKFSAVLARKCAKDQSLVPIVDKDGRQGRCPECGANLFKQAG